VRHPTLAMCMYRRWIPVAKLLIRYAEDSSPGIVKHIGIQTPETGFTDGTIVFNTLLKFAFVSFLL